MTRTTMLLAATLAGAVGLAAGCDDKASTSGATSGAPATAASTAPTATATAAPSAAASAEPTASAEPAASAVVPAASGSAKAFDCGAKGQKPCPMQGWMKTVMANASSSGEGDKLAKALTYVASHVPPGYGEWTAMAERGAARAKAGDIDGAKASCKQCHDAYKEKYKATMRDRPF